MFPQVERIVGDRRRDLYLLGSQTFDAVVDFCGYEPEDLRLSARELGSLVDHYLFISTISVYEDFSNSSINESSPIMAYPGDPSLQSYGNRKAECERILERELSEEKVLHIRPTIVVGEFDPTNRFEKWLRRIQNEEEFTIPSTPLQPIQWIDVLDLCEFSLRCLENGLKGVFNVCGPFSPMNLEEFSARISTHMGVPSHFSFDPESPQDFPFCTPPVYQGIFQVDSSKAIAQGLRFTPLENTLERTLRWLEEETR